MRQFTEAFKGTNFGTTDLDAVILEGLEKVACGYHNGRTLTRILDDLELISYRDGGTVIVLSDSGLQMMYDLKGARP